MTDINGKGYGDSHEWIRIYTNPYPISSSDKFSTYVCNSCRISFNHYYDKIESIFKNIEELGISDKCEKKKNG